MFEGSVSVKRLYVKKNRKFFRRKNSPGITEIHIPSQIDFDQEIPILRFELPLQTAADADYQHQLYKKGLEGFGVTEYLKQQRKTTYTIIGAAKIKRTIDLFLSLPEYKNSTNKKLKIELSNFQNECLKAIEKNKKDKLPTKAEDIENFTRLNNGFFGKKTIDENCSHDVYKIKHNETGRVYIFKKNATGRMISEIETFNGMCFKLLLDKQHPDVIAVRNAKGERLGVACEEIKGFKSVYDTADSGTAITFEKVVKSKMVKVWASAICEEEDDLHAGNYGFDKNGLCVDIDNDRATWPGTYKYTGVTAAGSEHRPKPNSCFNTTAEEIKNFPFLTTTKPNNFLFDKKSGRAVYPFGEALNTLYQIKQNGWKGRNAKEQNLLDEFNKDKYQVFLKRILTPDEVYRGIAERTLSTEHKRNEYVDYKIAKREHLTKELLKLPEFRDYLHTYGKQSIREIMHEFNNFNNEYKDDANIQVNLNKINNNYQQVFAEVNKRHPLVVNQRQVKQVESGNFLKQHPWLFGLMVGAAVVGIAACAFTIVGVMPAVLTAGAILGNVLTLGLLASSTTATLVGLSALASTCIAGFTYAASAIGKKLFDQPTNQPKNVIIKNVNVKAKPSLNLPNSSTTSIFKGVNAQPKHQLPVQEIKSEEKTVEIPVQLLPTQKTVDQVQVQEPVEMQIFQQRKIY